MSKQLRVALVAEGPTDGVVIKAALNAMLGEGTFVLTQLFPETSVAFGPLGTGWAGVYRWCQASAARGGGRLSGYKLLFDIGMHDLLILHLDADVAGERYENNSIQPLPSDLPLPCDRPCPPAADSVNELRMVLLSWCGETAVPPQTVLCTPSKSTEAWVAAALFPQDAEMERKGWECHPNPESRLGVQPLAARIRKSKADYQSKQQDITAAWDRLRNDLSEAGRFSTDFVNAVPASP